MSQEQIQEIIDENILPYHPTRQQWRNLISALMQLLSQIPYYDVEDYGFTGFIFQPALVINEKREELISVNINRLYDGSYALQPHDWSRYGRRSYRYYDVEAIIDAIQRMEHDTRSKFEILQLQDDVNEISVRFNITRN